MGVSDVQKERSAFGIVVVDDFQQLFCKNFRLVYASVPGCIGNRNSWNIVEPQIPIISVPLEFAPCVWLDL